MDSMFPYGVENASIPKLLMSGEELINEILNGRRKFAGIELEKGFNLSGNASFGKIQEYLTDPNTNLRGNPLIFSDSDLTGIIAKGLYAPHLILNNVILNKAVLDRAILPESKIIHVDGQNLNAEYTDFSRSQMEYNYFLEMHAPHVNFSSSYMPNNFINKGILEYSNAQKTIFNGSFLEDTSILHSDWKRAWLNEVYCKGLNVNWADLREVVMKNAEGIQEIQGLENALIQGMVVGSKKDKRFIESKILNNSRVQLDPLDDPKNKRIKI